jgi:fructan beta-fructosidase
VLGANWNEHVSGPQLLYDEKYRPQLHFSAPKNWLNDPNGLVWRNGVYHLFYQYNPTGNEWGNMHWGHAVSKNLVDWDVRPLALHAEPLGLGYMFSGCAVFDSENTSGLGSKDNAPMAAVYTSCSTDGIQAQSLAYSLDEGETWTQYASNPVIENIGIRDFRDPKVFWHASTRKWVMTLAADDHVEFYTSLNLIDWELVFRFGQQLGSHEGVWECPDLFPIKTKVGETKWALLISVSTEGSERDESIQYFIGDFNGQEFEPQHRHEIWIDHGADNYGAVTWDGMPSEDGRRVMIGWMNSWKYANAVPTYPWRGNMTIPREIRLVDGEHGYELASLPVEEVKQLRVETIDISPAQVGSDAVQALFTKLPVDLLDIDATFSWADQSPESFGIRFANATGEAVIITVDLSSNQLVVDRTTVGQRIPNKKFAERFEARLRQIDKSFTLRVIKDRASVEVFGDDGRAVISANLFFDEPFDDVAVSSQGDVQISGEASVLRSIWSNK